MRENDLRVIKTKKTIENSFWNLLKKKDFENIIAAKNAQPKEQPNAKKSLKDYSLKAIKNYNIFLHFALKC